MQWVVLFIALLIVPSTYAETRSSQALNKTEKLEAERRLADLGYWTGPVDGVLDRAFRHALIAFQKVEQRALTGRLTRNELKALRDAQRPHPKHAGFPHIEIDLQRQVLFIVDAEDVITHVLPVSSGNEKNYIDHGQVHVAHTPTGTFKVLRQIHGWRTSTLGRLYYPSYIYRGIAIHGSLSVPTYPASHGCIRVPMYAAKELSSLMPVGTEVIVYD